MAFGGLNRRREKRFHLKTIIALSRESSVLNQIKGFTKDLSMGGASCVIDEYLDVYTLVNVKIFLKENEDPIEVAGRITWIKEHDIEEEQDGSLEGSKKYMVGIQFLNLYSQKKKILKDFLFGNENK